MIFNCKKIFVGLLLLFGFAQIKATDSLTIRRAFNWQVGDTFVYSYYIWGDPYLPSGYNYPGCKDGFSVISRVNLNDSIVYTIQYFDSVVMQRVVTHLDSSVANYMPMHQFLRQYCAIAIDPPTFLLPNCDTPGISCMYQTYYDATFNNYLTGRQEYPEGEFGYFYIASERAGLRQIENNALEFWPPDAPPYQIGLPGGAGAILSYYRSGSIFWIDSASYFATGIDQINIPVSFHIYPNPTSNILFIERATNYAEGEEIKIYDLQSRLINTKKFPLNQNKAELDISNLSAGVYIVLLGDKQGQTIYRSKVLKQ